jgi:hypothetical protein
MQQNNYFNNLINIIINDNDLEFLITNINNQDIYDLDCYLENQMLYHLRCLVQKLVGFYIHNSTVNDVENIIEIIIYYHNLCKIKNFSFADILIVCRYYLRKIGGSNLQTTEKKHKNIILEGISVTLRSILKRKFDENRIDNNLREGAKERKAYLARLQKKQIPKLKVVKKGKVPKEKILKHSISKNTKQKFATTIINVHPEKDSTIIHTHEKTITFP